MLLLIGAGLGLLVGKFLYDAVTDDDSPKPKKKPRRKSKLEKNFKRLSRELGSHSGRKIAILGQPGSGKSSLLEKMTRGKVEPLPMIGTQTDATNWSVDVKCNLLSHYESYVFVDVPGYDTSSHPVRVFLSSFPVNQFDTFIFVINGKLHSSDEKIFRLLVRSGKPFCVARSFSESLSKEEAVSVEKDIRKRLGLIQSTPILFFSNRTGEGVGDVFASIKS